MKKKSFGVSMKNEWDDPKNKPTFGKRSMHSPQPGYKSTPPSVSGVGQEKKGKSKKSYPSKVKIEKAGNEIKKNPPAVLTNTKKEFGAKAEKRQKIAMMLSKARKK